MSLSPQLLYSTKIHIYSITSQTHFWKWVWLARLDSHYVYIIYFPRRLCYSYTTLASDSDSSSTLIKTPALLVFIITKRTTSHTFLDAAGIPPKLNHSPNDNQKLLELPSPPRTNRNNNKPINWHKACLECVTAHAQ